MRKLTSAALAAVIALSAPALHAAVPAAAEQPPKKPLTMAEAEEILAGIRHG